MMVEESMTECVVMKKTPVPDGEGGFFTQWEDGPQIRAAISFDTSMQARTAEKLGVTSLYTVTVAKNVALEYHDVIKRLEDGKVLRITSDGDDKKTPRRASFHYRQVSAEEWVLP